MINGHGFVNVANLINNTEKLGRKKWKVRHSRGFSNNKLNNFGIRTSQISQKRWTKNLELSKTQWTSVNKNMIKNNKTSSRKQEDKLNWFSITHSSFQLQKYVPSINKIDNTSLEHKNISKQRNQVRESSPSTNSQNSKTKNGSFLIYPSNELNFEDIFEIDLSGKIITYHQAFFNSSRDKNLFLNML